MQVRIENRLFVSEFLESENTMRSKTHTFLMLVISIPFLIDCGLASVSTPAENMALKGVLQDYRSNPVRAGEIHVGSIFRFSGEIFAITPITPKRWESPTSYQVAVIVKIDGKSTLIFCYLPNNEDGRAEITKFDIGQSWLVSGTLREQNISESGNAILLFDDCVAIEIQK